MSQIDLDRCFISQLLATKDMLTVKDQQISEKFFSGDYKTYFRFIQQTVLETGEVPSERVFKNRFRTFVPEKFQNKIGTEENLLFWCTEIRKRARHNAIAEAMNSAREDMEVLDTEDAYSKLRSVISKVESDFTLTTDADITQDVEDRVQAYLKRKESEGIVGIPTMLNSLDLSLRGLEGGTLTTLIAKTGVGKSWFEIVIGVNMMLQGYKVLQFVTEMSESIMRDRYEAYLFAKCSGIKLNYSHFKSGRLDTRTERKFIQFLREDMPNLSPLVISTATSPMGVAATIDKYKPDIVFIDGVYLMEDDRNSKDEWARIMHITQDLKKLAKRLEKVPIFINTQADKNSSKKTGPAIEDMSYSQSIGRDSDNIISIYRDEIMINDKEMGLKVLKNREGEQRKIIMHWDFDTMTFNEIYSEESGNGSTADNTVDI